MITWTAAGVVSAPEVLQVRVQRSYPGRVHAGAPIPTRGMSAEEVQANILHFTVGMRTPRTRPCHALVLSGVGVFGRPDVPEAIRLARREGVRTVTLHAGPEDLEALDPSRYIGLLDRLVLPVGPAPTADAIQAARTANLDVVANVVLHPDRLPTLAALVSALIRAAPTAVTFTYPFPAPGRRADQVPHPTQATAALATALPLLDEAGIRADIKGLPACHLGPLASRLRKSGNRWYVDADHQTAQALLFFPDVVAFHKADACRFCAADPICDGTFERWLPQAPPLTPLEHWPPRP